MSRPILAVVAVSLALGACKCKDNPREPWPITGKKGSLSGDLVVFHAGSLAVPFKKISEAFMKEHPGVKVMLEAAGSRACARKITDLKRDCDVMASADYTVIDSLLIPEHAAWNIKFATNEMAIVYHHKSREHERLSADDWPEVLMMDEVAFGRADPDQDPCGYRAVLVMKLAETHYKTPGLAARMMAKDLDKIRPKETDLLALLETGEIDYIFLSRSVAQQHGLDYLVLPDEVNLQKPELGEKYRTATVRISGKRPGEKVSKRGEPMVYGITIPKSSPNPEAALAFVKFVLSRDEGMAIIEQSGQPSCVPSASETFDEIPEGLKDFARR